MTLMRLGLAVALLALTGCAQLEEATRPLLDELAREFQDRLQEALKQAAAGLADTVEEAIAGAAAAADDWFQEQGDAIREEHWPAWMAWLGREAPDEVGRLELGSVTRADAGSIRAAFQAAFRQAGGGRVLGWPSANARVEHGAISQRFTKGAILMADDAGASVAYFMPEPWYDVFDAAGGTRDAGIPATSPEAWGAPWWQFWARGKRQLMLLRGEAYALVQPARSEEVFLVPPEFWQAYLDSGGYDALGYPLSGFPLDEEAAVGAALGNDELSEAISVWQERPYRIQVFSRGSLWFDQTYSNHEVILAEPIGEYFSAETLLLNRMGVVFGERGYELSISDPCLSATVDHAGAAMVNDSTTDLITWAANIPLESALSAVPASSTRAVLGKLAAQALVELAGSDDLAEDSFWFATGVLADSFFSKAIGDYLAAPFAAVSTEGLKASVESVNKDLVVAPVAWEAGRVEPSTGTMMEFPGRAVVLYNPLTHMITGFMKLENECPPYAFQMRIEPLAGEPLNAPVWPADAPEYFDLEARKPVH